MTPCSSSPEGGVIDTWNYGRNSVKLRDYLIVYEVLNMSLTPKIKQQLKAKAHKLKPVIMIGNNGLTDAVNKEIDRALHDHELIKIRVQTNDRDVRREVINEICKVNQAELVQIIGSIGVVYRVNSSK